MLKRGDELHCIKCGRFCVYDPDDDEFTTNLFHQMSVYFGYSSPFDDEKIDFTLCELCLFEFWKTCKHRPSSEYEKDIVNAYDHFRTNEDPHYKDYFIKTYKALEDLKKK
ncbi:hypothetical protein PDN46_27965 [Bacillus cereus group sp. Bc191]|uniref:hypothetical protein n=1 Tax=Bacillus cereus group sp. Bc191 TaxID=3018113 RepID=UPI0022E60C1B|nr:hypothetical protein [Bacillus cereus group sp. Bc191]MDA2292097.1 hypothetical protein [Bacillus cereus group sp. Bc191]